MSTISHQSLLGSADSVASNANPLLQNWRDYFPEVVGRSMGLQQTLRMVAKIARTDSSVLIFGESGTGKELIASALHRLSHRSSRTYIQLNCTTFPHNLMESALFGHEKGAFTGADRKHVGHFEKASGGTILLDEIGDMPLDLQAKILRVLQEKQYMPVGSSETRSADVRIVAATNVNLEEAVKGGQFRQDLFYRLNVLPVYVPALRDREGDVPLLLEHFLRLANDKHALENPCFFDGEVIEHLNRYAWPGNIRELQNLVERLVVISNGGPITLKDLPDQYRRSAHAVEAPREVAPAVTIPSRLPGESPVHYPANFGSLLPEDGLDLTKIVEDLENGYILQALERTNYNKNQAAKLLGLNRTTLVERIKKRKLAPLNMPSKEL